jgi:hypothetical protein
MYSTGTQNINLGDMNLLLLLNASNVGFLGLSSNLGIESGSCEREAVGRVLNLKEMFVPLSAVRHWV